MALAYKGPGQALAILCLYAVSVCTAFRPGCVQIEHLSTFSTADPPAVTRILFSQEDVAARNYVKDTMSKAGLIVSEDAMGTIYGTWTGMDPEQGSVATGSHCDAIPLSGKYDGVVGVLGAISAVAALREAGFQPQRTLEVMMFTSEEPTRFGISCLGSRAMARTLSPSALTQVQDEHNLNFMQAAAAAGSHTEDTPEATIEAVAARAAGIAYFVELHIEQGPDLEAAGVDIGIVTSIAAPSTIHIEFHGDGGHAGSQLMPVRNDASLAAAELCLAVERLALETGGVDTVATCGQWQVEPNAVNSVPRVVALNIDLRDTDEGRRDRILEAILSSADAIGARRSVRVVKDVLNKDAPATCSTDVQRAASQAVHELKQLRKMSMVSHAYHDSLFMAKVAPTGMLFIPCYKGYSHRPEELSSAGQMAAGVRVLALTLAKLAQVDTVHVEL
eukprot:jgi/Ulvmu1/4667/UM002_0398.1